MKLIPIDISKAEKHECPGIKTDGTEYLCMIDGKCFAGVFHRIWYGLNFYGWHSPLQFDAPGSNCSHWQAIWEIQHDFKPLPRPPKVMYYCEDCGEEHTTEDCPWEC